MKNCFTLIVVLLAATAGRAQNRLQCYLAPNDRVYSAGQRIEMSKACGAPGGAVLYHRQKGRWEPYRRGEGGLFIISRIVRDTGGAVFFYMKYAPGKDPVDFRLEASRVLEAGSCFTGEQADTTKREQVAQERLAILFRSGQMSQEQYDGAMQSLHHAFAELEKLRRRRDAGEISRDEYFSAGQALLNQYVKQQ